MGCTRVFKPAALCAAVLLSARSGAGMPSPAATADSSIAQGPADAALLTKVKAYPTGIWLDRISKLQTTSPTPAMTS